MFGHSESTWYPINVTLDGISIEVRPEQPSNAYSKIVVTLDGISIDVRPEQP